MKATVSERELAFLLYEFLDSKQLLQRPRYAGHSREVFDAVLDTARRLAEDVFAPHNATGDQNQPVFKDGVATLIADTGHAWREFAKAGFLNAHWDADEGGLQLPEVVLRAALASFFTANVATAAYPFLTIGAANLLRAFGNAREKQRYLAAMGDGRSSGTMALTEPDQGSALGDIRTTAVAQPDGSYRIRGQKIFISGGDQDFTGNIVHMVLARIQGAPAGARGISLFLVPKLLAEDDGSPGERNDVALAGLLHKMGWRNTTSTLLSFGENGGAIGYLVGQPNQGLAHMFQMMNEARIGVGLIASCLAYRGYAESLDYARQRRQGRPPSMKDPLAPQVPLVGHADIRRMLLAQKACAEGALALCLYASALFEDQHTHPDPQARAQAAQLLDVLTPVVKSWPSRQGCTANDLAMQVLGGAGYTSEYPLEQLYRDQRLNPIHEGAEAIHGLDLLGRKVAMDGGAAFALYAAALRRDIEAAQHAADGPPPCAGQALKPWAHALAGSLDRLQSVTALLVAELARDPDLALANATVYLEVFGRITAAWMWLKQATAAAHALDAGAAGPDAPYYHGKLQAARYYFAWELPAAHVQFALLESLDRTPLDMKDEWFQ